MPEKESYCRLKIAGYRVKPNLTIKEKQKFETKQNKIANVKFTQLSHSVRFRETVTCFIGHEILATGRKFQILV